MEGYTLAHVYQVFQEVHVCCQPFRFYQTMQISQSQKYDPTSTKEKEKMNFDYHVFWIMW